MIIEKLVVSHVRNIQQAELHFDHRTNIITGLNASGKTSLLEAIHLLFVGKSFRTSKIDQIIHTGQDNLLLTSRLYDPDRSQSHSLGIRRERKNVKIRFNNETVRSISQLARIQPVVLITPESQHLITGGPTQRRTLIDWLLFHVEHIYHRTWSDYQNVLKQRNSSLKKKSKTADIHVWDAQLIEKGERLNHLRASKSQDLIDVLSRFVKDYFDSNLQIRFYKGWSGDFSEVIKENHQRDQIRGFTSKGPHRADLLFTIDGNPVDQVFSRGQSKLLSILLELAKLDVLEKLTGLKPILLIDDIAAELDIDNKERITKFILEFPAQRFLTSTDISLLPTELVSDAKVFHVEHGFLKEVL